jgi:CheY-like chemotaxis protein
MFALQASQKNIRLDFSIASDTTECLRGDCQRLRQILINLLGNAIKFTAHGEVCLNVRQTSGASDRILLRFTVTDTGVGVPLAKQSMIFVPFEQADGSATRIYGGTGLGLAISAKLVAAMNGIIWVESPWHVPGTREEVAGSAFHFTAQFDMGERPLPAAGPAQPTFARPLRILLAEDNLVNQKLMTSVLRRAGHSVSVAGDGQEALEILNRTTVDLILMDIQMPKMDGFEVTSRIREQERAEGGHMPIVALTAHALVSDTQRCLDAGMDAYVSKPVHFEQLNRTMQAVVRGQEDLHTTAAPG